MTLLAWLVLGGMTAHYEMLRLLIASNVPAETAHRRVISREVLQGAGTGEGRGWAPSKKKAKTGQA